MNQASEAPKTAHVVAAGGSAAVELPRILWTFKDFGKRIGISERKAHDVVKALGITPVVLGPRCVRLVPSECEVALARLPRRVVPVEPGQLLRGRIERAKKTGQLAPTPTAASATHVVAGRAAT